MNKHKILILLIVFLLSLTFSQGGKAYGTSFGSTYNSYLLTQATVDEEKQEEDKGEKELTKGDFILLLAATDYLKKKIQALLSWSVGYDVTKIARTKLVPTIKYIKAMPIKAPPDGRTIIQLIASVDDPQGLKNIEYVSANLSNIGRLPNSVLVDNGLWGDKIPNDGVYTLQTSVDQDIAMGPKEISVAVSNKKGWLTLSKTTLDVEKAPKILGSKASPERIKAGEEPVVTFTVKVENPGRIEDIKSANINLDAIGGKMVKMRNDGKEGDEAAGDDIFTYRAKIPAGLSEGIKRIPVKVINVIGGVAEDEIILTVVR